MRGVNIFIIASAASVCSTAIPAFAQTERVESTDAEILVTAQRREEKLQDVPVTVSVQSAERIEAAGVRSISDIGKLVAGLNFAQNELFAQPSLRGVTTTSFASSSESPVAIYLDGSYQPAMFGAQFELPDVERIEVVKGPQGTLFGRNATGGAVQIFTKEPKYELGGKIIGTAGLYTGGARDATEFSGSGFITGPLVQDKLAVSIAGYARHNQGFLQDIASNKRTGEQSLYGVRGKLLFEPSERAKFLLTGFYSWQDDYSTSNRAALNKATIAAGFPDAVLPTRPWEVSNIPGKPQHLRLKTISASLKGTFDLDVGSLTAVTTYSKVNQRSQTGPAAAWSQQCFTALRCTYWPDYNNYHESLSQDLNFTSKTFGIFSFTTGAFLYRDFGTTQDTRALSGTNFNVPVIATVDTTRTTAYAVYAEGNLDLTDHIHLILGGRYSNEKKTPKNSLNGIALTDFPGIQDSSFTPRASLRYEFNPSTSAYATFSQGFKSGQLPRAFEPYRTLNLLVRPEKLTAYEVGFKTARRDYALNLAYYHYDYKDLQLTAFVPGVALATTQNAAKAKMDGFDVEGWVRATQNLRLTVAFNYMPTAKYADFPVAQFLTFNQAGFGPPVASLGDASGLRLLKAPKLSGTIGLSWSHEYHFGQLGVDANLYHSSAQKFDNLGTIKNDAYEDLSGQIYLDRNGIRFAIYGRNLFNKAVIVGSNPSTGQLPVIYGAPRQVGVSASYSF